MLRDPLTPGVERGRPLLGPALRTGFAGVANVLLPFQSRPINVAAVIQSRAGWTAADEALQLRSEIQVVVKNTAAPFSAPTEHFSVTDRALELVQKRDDFAQFERPARLFWRPVGLFCALPIESQTCKESSFGPRGVKCEA